MKELVILVQEQKNCQPCKKCSDNVNKEKSLSVKIPAGVDEGTRIRIGGEGEAGKMEALQETYIFMLI